MLALLPGCSSCDSIPAGAVTNCQSTQILPASVQTDILFVIDDSGSMNPNQANLASNLDAFIATLAASPVKNDFRIGVTNSSIDGYTVNGITPTSYPANTPSAGDPYPAGALVAVKTDSSGNPIVGAFIYDKTLYASTGGWGGNRILDKASPTLVADFKANVRVGISGSGKEQPLRAARLALTDRLADANKGFLRDGARLAIIILSDDDDCSDSAAPFANSETDCHSNQQLLDPIGDFKAFVQGPIGGEIRDVAMGVIAGLDPTTLGPSCGDASLCSDSACGTAEGPGNRYLQLAAALAPTPLPLGSICDTSFHDTLVRFAASLTPSSVPLAQVPADWRMLAVQLTKSGGAVVPCTVGLAGASNQATVDAVYSGPQIGKPAELTFQNACKLDLGDKVDIHVVCAG
jgi:hypothetical protein